MIQIAAKILITVLIISVCFYGLRYIWSHQIDIPKIFLAPIEKIIPTTQTIDPPKVIPSIITETHYSPGLRIHDIIWQEDYADHLLTVENRSDSRDIFDLRLELELPGPILYYKQFEDTGSQDLSFSQLKPPAGIAQKDSLLLHETIDYYTNNLLISAVKLFPKSKFSLNIVLRHITKDPGKIFLNYRYLMPDGQYQNKSLAYSIDYSKSGNNHLFVNVEHPLTGKVEGSYMFIPKDKLILAPDGSIRKEK